MRGESGIDIAQRDRGATSPPRLLVCLLTVLALLMSSGALSGGGNALADEADDDAPHGIDLPFTSRDDDERESESAEAGAAGGSTFALTAYVCTPGEDSDLRDRLLVESSQDPDAFFEDGIELEELRDVCTAPAEALTYTLTDLTTDKTDSRELGGDEEASFTWTNLSTTGSLYTLAVDGPETYTDPIVICTVASDPPGMLTQYFATDGAIRFSSADGSDNTCEWFNVDLGDMPAGVGDDTDADAAGFATPIGSPTGIATIAIEAHTCTPGDDSELLDRIAFQLANPNTVDPIQGIALDALQSTCDAPGEEIAFTVTNTQDSSEGETQGLRGDGSAGYVTWDMEATMIHSVDAAEPEGYGAPIVFCALGDGEALPTPMLDGVMYAAIGAGSILTCDWFHVDLGAQASGDESTTATGAADGNFALRAYTCTPGDDAELRARIAYQIDNWTTVDPEEGITLDELREACEPADGSIPFSVTEDESGDRDDLVVAGEDPVSVALEPLASYTIAADEPEGYGEPLLFCALDGGDPSQSPIIDGTLFLILGEDVTDSCEWFHVDLGDEDA